jgi:EAL domain-containing protein (putative c-di-GMP-specific phosphodiesterase class I)
MQGDGSPSRAGAGAAGRLVGAPPPALGECSARIAEQFREDGALGVVLVDAAPLAEIERRYGSGAYRGAMAALNALVHELLADKLCVSDLVVEGESGRTELAVLLFRPSEEIDFYQSGLEEIARLLSQGIAARGHGVAYPYKRKLPQLFVGTGIALRNPTLREEAQLRDALEEAREEVQMRGRVAARRRRRELVQLLVEGRVTAVFEPIVEVQSRIVFGYEALSRGPEGSELRSPAVLFESAMRHDLVFQLDCLCRQRALEGARDLPGKTKLFLNVRPTTIHDPSFKADVLERTLASCKLRPSDVVFEISEQESIDNFAMFREVRDSYGKLGFQIALDDTGSGYSSLEAVMELAPEFIKVDRAFVTRIDEDPARQELLRALQSLSQRLGSRIIGEGLDTLEELETLGRLGIPFGQGWLFGKPHPLRSDV